VAFSAIATVGAVVTARVVLCDHATGRVREEHFVALWPSVSDD